MWGGGREHHWPPYFIFFYLQASTLPQRHDQFVIAVFFSYCSFAGSKSALYLLQVDLLLAANNIRGDGLTAVASSAQPISQNRTKE